MDISQGNAIQEKIKKLMREKKLAKQNQSIPSSRKRITSQTVTDHHDKQLSKKQTQSDDLSMRSEWTRRNTRQQKIWDTQNSEATSSEANNKNNRIEVQKIVNNIFSHSPKLLQYLQQYNLGKQNALNQLLSNQLFVLSLSSKISKLPNNKNDKDSLTLAGDLNGIVENQIILKLTKLHRKKKQSFSLYNIENRINSLITNRLQILKKY